MPRDEAKIMIEFDIPLGVGEDDSGTSAILKPYNQVVTKGHLAGKVNHLFFKDASKSRRPTRTLGSICLTSKQRILFFPALTEQLVLWTYNIKDGFRNREPLREFIDHITLDPGYERGHFQMLTDTGNPASRWSTFRTIELDNAFFWFALVLKDDNVLELTPKKLKGVFQVPDTDAQRRVDQIVQANHKAEWHVVSLNNKSLNRNEFLFLEFILGPEDLDVSSLSRLVPLQPPIITKRPTNPKDKEHIRAHPCSLIGLAEKVWVIVSKHVGTPAEKAILALNRTRSPGCSSPRA